MQAPRSGRSAADRSEHDDLLGMDLEPVETRFRRNSDFADVLDFDATIRRCMPDDDYTDDPDDRPTHLGPVAAHLRGFAYCPGHVPGDEGHESGDHDIFDARSGHADEAYGLLVTERPRIGKALKSISGLEDLYGIILDEHAFVVPECRGKRLGLLLMREVKHILAQTSSLILLKAHPDGREASGADCRRLAKYYQSDKQLGLKPISSRLHPGWLVASTLN